MLIPALSQRNIRTTNTKMRHYKAQTASHWYFRDGSPCHEVVMKTDKTKTRDTNLSDARKLGLYPSVTNIIKILDAPQLDTWKINQYINFALTLPVIEGETVDERAQRVVRTGFDELDVARRRGTLAHRCIEEYLTDGDFKPHDEVAEIMAPFLDWFKDTVSEVFYTEKTLVGAGYAGRVDLCARLKGYDDTFILDFKTRKPSQGKLRCYDEDGMQLGAYAMAELLSQGPDPQEIRTASILINSEIPSTPTLSVWSKEDQERLSKAFLSTFETWKLLKGYDPEQTKQD